MWYNVTNRVICLKRKIYEIFCSLQAETTENGYKSRKETSCQSKK